MDPSPISPVPTPATTAVAFTTQPNNNNHPPLPLSAPPIPTHPPYAEMIYTAIEALKEKDGSSKRAISKYIEQVYKEHLPSTHSTLLTHHLKRLKACGLLQMVKKSYMLPRSIVPPENNATTVDSSAAAAAAQVSPPPASRPRGRPRKIPTTQAQPQAQAQVQAQNQAQPDNNNNNDVWAALGLADEPAVQAVPLEVSKRRPGRPRRSVGAVPAPTETAAASQVGSGPSVATPARRGRPPGSKSVSKRRPGRPPKNVHVSAPAETVAAAGVVSSLPKRRPGRPAKNQQSQPTPIPFAAAVSETAPVEIASGEVASGEVIRSRGRGRPRKNAVPVVAAPVTAGRGRGRGRGRGSGGGRGSGAGRGRGRGRGGLNVQPLARPGRRPVGRPRKGTTSASAPPNAANEDFKRKLEHFQAKVKESLAVLKPHFNHESPVTAIAAIQELEVLGTMDLNAPLKDEAVLPPQQPQPQPQQQQLVQQYPLPPQQHTVYQQQFSELHMQQYHHQQLQQYPQQPAPQQQQQFHP